MRSNGLKGKLLLCKDCCSITDNNTYTEASRRARVMVALAELKIKAKIKSVLVKD